MQNIANDRAFLDRVRGSWLIAKRSILHLRSGHVFGDTGIIPRLFIVCESAISDTHKFNEFRDRSSTSLE
jgi:hypothetical protein